MIVCDTINDNNNDIYSTDIYVEIQGENVFIKYYGEERKREVSEKQNNSASHLLSRYPLFLGN